MRSSVRRFQSSLRPGLIYEPLKWRHNERDGVSNHRRLDCLLSCLFRRRSKKISKLCVTGLCEGNPPVTGGFPSQRSSNAKNVSICWRHHAQTSLIRVMASRIFGALPLLTPILTYCLLTGFSYTNVEVMAYDNYLSQKKLLSVITY